jgi:hypothetical protein
MNSTTEGRKPWNRYAMERSLAPHVDEKWAGNFILELRMLDIAGARIGAALTEVESHCNESGQSAQRVFGDPVEYARSLQRPVDDGHSTRALLRSLVPMMVQMFGMGVLNWSFEDWLRGQQLQITTGHLVSSSIGFLAVAAVAIFADSVLRAAAHFPIRSAIPVFLVYLAVMATSVAALIFLDEVIWRVASGWGLATGAAILAGGVAWAVARIHAHGPEEDPITSPFDDADTAPSDKATGHLGRLSGSSWLAWFPYIALIPLGTLSLFAMTLVLHRVGAK